MYSDSSLSSHDGKNKSLYDSDWIKFDSISGEISCTPKIDALNFEVGSQKSEVGSRKSEVGSPSSAFVVLLLLKMVHFSKIPKHQPPGKACTRSPTEGNIQSPKCINRQYISSKCHCLWQL